MGASTSCELWVNIDIVLWWLLEVRITKTTYDVIRFVIYVSFFSNYFIKVIFKTVFNQKYSDYNIICLQREVFVFHPLRIFSFISCVDEIWVWTL